MEKSERSELPVTRYVGRGKPTEFKVVLDEQNIDQGNGYGDRGLECKGRLVGQFNLKTKRQEGTRRDARRWEPLRLACPAGRLSERVER